MDAGVTNIDGRKFARVPFRRAVRYKLHDQDRFLGHLAQDLSQGGLRIFSSEFLPVNSTVNVQIQLKDRMKVMDVPGRVVWTRFNPMTEIYQLGLEFADEAAFQRAMIGEFVGKS